MRDAADTCDNSDMLGEKILTDDVRRQARQWLLEWIPDTDEAGLALGLPEWDDRLGLWRVALVLETAPGQPVGEIQAGCRRHGAPIRGGRKESGLF